VLGPVAPGQRFVVAAGLTDLSPGMIAGLVVELASAPMDGAPSVMVSVSTAMPALDAGTGAANGLMANLVRPTPLRPTFGVLPVLGGRDLHRHRPRHCPVGTASVGAGAVLT
jgi:ribose/xylose/arabinose/galactoside ABC-type transport system permease subunit